MRSFTEKQLKFIDNKAQGLKDKQAGLMAGFAPNSVSQTVSALMQRPEIKKAIAAKRKELGKPVVDNKKEIPLLKDHYDSPLALYDDLWNNPNAPLGLRVEAAKQAMPYHHARIGEQGKKEKKDIAAKEVAKGRFQTKQPPRLVSVK
jgi:phage terminase small subunit